MCEFVVWVLFILFTLLDFYGFLTDTSMYCVGLNPDCFLSLKHVGNNASLKKLLTALPRLRCIANEANSPIAIREVEGTPRKWWKNPVSEFEIERTSFQPKRAKDQTKRILVQVKKGVKLWLLILNCLITLCSYNPQNPFFFQINVFIKHFKRQHNDGHSKESKNCSIPYSSFLSSTATPASSDAAVSADFDNNAIVGEERAT